MSRLPSAGSQRQLQADRSDAFGMPRNDILWESPAPRLPGSPAPPLLRSLDARCTKALEIHLIPNYNTRMAKIDIHSSKRVIKIIAIAAGAIILLVIAGFVLKALIAIYSSRPHYDDEITASFIEQKTEVLWDKYGVPHIFARNENDYLFALGYIHAMERLFQMEGYRRLADGRISEIAGERAIAFDKFYRCLGFSETIDSEEFILKPEFKEKINYYVHGVNYFIKNHQDRLPPEFYFTKVDPDLWTIRDTLKVLKVMSWNFSYNYDGKKQLWKIKQKMGGLDNTLRHHYPADYPVIIPQSEIPQTEIKPDALVSWFTALTQGAASNAWAISPELSQSNSPILANDTHTMITLPTAWYEIHANIAGENILGVTMPGAPFVLIGRNDAIAWGMTVLPADTQDIVFRKESDFNDPNFTKKIARINIKDGDTALINVITSKYSRGITPKCDDSFSSRSYELFWTGFVPGESLYSLYLLNKAHSWEEFVNASSYASAPALNFVYADRKGNIGYYPVGLIPKRIAPVSFFPYDSLQKWDGFLSEKEKPILFNPPSHYIITANNKITDNDEIAKIFGVDWTSPFRAKRIKELLSSKKKFSIDDFRKYQTDVKDPAAEIINKYITDLPGDMLSQQAAPLKYKLAKWNAVIDDSTSALIYSVFYEKFMKNTFEDEMGTETYKVYARYVIQGKYAGVLTIIENNNNKWFDDVRTNQPEDRNTIIATSLEDTYRWLEEEYGKNMEQWKWSALHKVHYVHPLGTHWALGWLFNIAPFGVPGNGNTISRARHNSDEDYDVQSVPAFRIVMDLSRIENTYSTLNIGQSGHPWSPHYQDQVINWRNGILHEWVLDRTKLVQSSSSSLIFLPRNK